MRLTDDNEIRELVRSFEEATIGRDEWKHAEHMIVGLYYLETFGIEAAGQKMRKGILNLLSTGFKLDLLKEMPYHETITIFWMKTLEEFRANRDGTLSDKVNGMLEVFDKDYPLRFYSRERLFSDEARAGYLPPDLDPSLEDVSATN